MTETITAAAALVSAFFGPMVSLYVAKRGIAAAVVSAHRQARISSLQGAIAEFLAKEQMARNLNRQRHADDRSIERIQEIVCLNYRIRLLIDPREEDDNELIKLIDHITNTINRSGRQDDSTVEEFRKQVPVLSQRIFIRELDRAKRGQ